MSTGTFTLTNASVRQYTITHSAWALTFSSNGCEYFGWFSISHVTWTLTVNDLICSWVIDRNGTAWTLTINWWQNLNSTITNSSAWTMSLTRTILTTNSTVNMVAWSWWTVTLTDCIFEQFASLQKLNASTTWNVSLSSCTFMSNWFFQTSGTGNFTWTQCTITWSSRFNVASGDRNYYLTRVDWHEVAQIYLSWTWAWIQDNFDDIHISSRWVLIDSCSWTASNRIKYSTITWLSWQIWISWTSANQTIQRVTANYWSLSVSNCTVAMTHDLIILKKAWTMSISNLTVAKPVTYCEVWPQSSMSVTWTVAWGISRVVIMSWSCDISWTTSTVSNLSIEQWTVNISWWSILNCSKKMVSTWTITWWAQNASHHWNVLNKSSAVANTNRIDHLWVVSSVPIL